MTSAAAWGVSEDNAAAYRRAVGPAALLFFIYAVVQVLVNGILLDETVLAGQVIAGHTPYPPGHPHYIYYPRAFSLSQYLSAATLLLVGTSDLASAVRNVLFLFMSTLSLWSLTFVITQQRLWAYFAVFVALAEVQGRFEGVYPMMTFPYIYSNGQLGLYFSILTVALTVGRMWGIAAFFLGVLPSVHGSFALIIWPWALAYFLTHGAHRQRRHLLKVLGWGSLGVAICVGLYLVIQLTAPDAPAVAPYDVTANEALIRANFRRFTDVHRRNVGLRNFEYMVGAAGFFALTLLAWTQTRTNRGSDPKSSLRSGQVLWVGILGAMIWFYLWGSLALEATTGWLPKLVEISMPARLPNLPSTLLIPLTAIAAGLAHERMPESKRPGFVLILGLLSVGAAVAVIPGLPFELRDRVSRTLLFVVWGTIGAAVWVQGSRRAKTVVAVAGALTVGGVLASTEATFVYAYMLAAGLVAGLFMTRFHGLLAAFSEPRSGWPATVLVVGMSVFAVTAMPDRSADFVFPQHVRWDKQSPDTLKVKAWLKENARPDEMVLATFMPRIELQVKTGQPVLYELKTLWMMSYMPHLAPVLNEMVRDLYGVDYLDAEALEAACETPGEVSIWCPVWTRAWQARTHEDWRALGAKYDFRLVMAPADIELDLEPVVPGVRWTLYVIEPRS